MIGVAAAIAGAVAAGGCCLAPTRWRARALAVVMALACLPFLPVSIRLAAAVGLIVAAVALSAGSRRLPDAERAADLHRAMGGALMAGMLLAGGHADTAVVAGHAHGWAGSPHSLLAAASVVYLAWTALILVRAAHGRRLGRAARVELSAMGAMFALLVIAMAVG